MERFNFISGITSDLQKKPLLSMNYSTSEGGTGHCGFICHKQPFLEKAIRDVIEASEYSTLRTSSTVKAIEEDDNYVYVDYTNGQGGTRRIRASFLVGADGKTGYVRKKYLEPKGIVMEQCEG
jgi:2-polyprenyl-6-methoxyphenol hydroxylase-like FAD-dependent oxidoreductase